jgi:hypothetical protein
MNYAAVVLIHAFDSCWSYLSPFPFPIPLPIPLPLYQVLSILNAIWFVITINVDFTSGSIETAKKDARMQ